VDLLVLRQLAFRNRFSQYPQTCTVAPVARAEPASLGGTSKLALLEAAGLAGPSSGCCHATGLAAGRRGITLAKFVVLGPEAAAFPAPSSPSGPSRVPPARPAPLALALLWWQLVLWPHRIYGKTRQNPHTNVC